MLVLVDLGNVPEILRAYSSNDVLILGKGGYIQRYVCVSGYGGPYFGERGMTSIFCTLIVSTVSLTSMKNEDKFMHYQFKAYLTVKMLYDYVYTYIQYIKSITLFVGAIVS